MTNPGYVARILNEYYPNDPDLPAIGSPGITNAADQGAAVQAAIWYFSDNYVVATTDPKSPAVAAIVNAVRVQPPLDPPTEPISIDPSSATGDAGSIVGPSTVRADVVGPLDIALTARGGELFLDAAGTEPVTTPVPPDTEIWVRSATVGDVTIVATAVVEVQSGAAWLYSGNIVGVDAAQKLILAETIELEASAQAVVVFQQPTTTTSTSTTTTTTSTTTTTTTVPTTTTTTSPTTTTTSSTSTSMSTSSTSTSTPSTSTSTTVAKGGSGGRLPDTGSDMAPLLVVAGLVALIGVVIVVTARRSPSAQP